jgi:hypothetical protein
MRGVGSGSLGFQVYRLLGVGAGGGEQGGAY